MTTCPRQEAQQGWNDPQKRAACLHRQLSRVLIPRTTAPGELAVGGRQAACPLPKSTTSLRQAADAMQDWSGLVSLQA